MIEITRADLNSCAERVGEGLYERALPLSLLPRLARTDNERRRGGAGDRLPPDERLAIMMVAARGVPARKIAADFKRNILTVRRVLRSKAYARLQQRAVEHFIGRAYGRRRSRRW